MALWDGLIQATSYGSIYLESFYIYIHFPNSYFLLPETFDLVVILAKTEQLATTVYVSNNHVHCGEHSAPGLDFNPTKSKNSFNKHIDFVYCFKLSPLTFSILDFWSRRWNIKE